VAVYAFAWQIYCDFSGYTDMARGCAKWMGFELQDNFNVPYLAVDPATSGDDGTLASRPGCGITCTFHSAEIVTGRPGLASTSFS